MHAKIVSRETEWYSRISWRLLVYLHPKGVYLILSLHPGKMYELLETSILQMCSFYTHIDLATIVPLLHHPNRDSSKPLLSFGTKRG